MINVNYTKIYMFSKMTITKYTNTSLAKWHLQSIPLAKIAII